MFGFADDAPALHFELRNKAVRWIPSMSSLALRDVIGGILLG